jgi:hypothetical protein
MIKPLALAALALSLPFIPAALGCSSSSSPASTGDDTGMDSGTGNHDSGTGTDTGTGNHDGGETFDSATGHDTGTTMDANASTCPADTSGFTGTPYATVTATPGVCGSDEIQAFVTACGDNQTQTSCMDWLSATDGGASDACGTCIEGSSSNTSNGAIYFDVGGGLEPNYGACIQLTDTTHGAACGAAVNNVIDCVATACDMCADQTSYDTCTTTEYSSSGSCASYGSTESTACANDTGDAGAIATCQPGGGTSQDPDYTYIINLVCGTGG